MTIALGPWQFDGRSYRAPVGARNVVDMRRAGDPKGPSLFAFPAGERVPSEYRPIAEGPADVVTERNAAILASGLGLRSSFPGRTFAELLALLLTEFADPAGHTAPKPLTPGHHGQMEIFAGSRRIWSHRFDPASPWCGPTLDLLRRGYQRCKAAALAHGRSEKDRNHYRRYLGSLCLELGIPAEAITLSDKEEDRSHPPETTITESFPGTGMFGGDLSWSQLAGTWENSSDEGRLATTDGTKSRARAEHDLSSSNHYAEVKVTQLNSGSMMDTRGGACARFSAGGDETFYLAEVRRNTSGTEYWHSVKFESGMETTLDGPSPTLLVFPVLMKSLVSGSTIFIYMNDVLQESETDTAIPGNTRGGLFGLDDSAVYGVKFDDFRAADLPVAVNSAMIQPPPPNPAAYAVKSVPVPFL